MNGKTSSGGRTRRVVDDKIPGEWKGGISGGRRKDFTTR